MREIKFRIWNGREFIDAAYGDYGTEYKVEGFSYSPVEVVRRYYGEWDDEESDMVIQQFTGLLDKNGVEIYEGDIVTYTSINGKDYKAEIVFSPTLAAFVLDTSGRHLLDDKYGDYYELHKDHSYEVVGNIFENSELLK